MTSTVYALNTQYDPIGGQMGALQTGMVVGAAQTERHLVTIELLAGRPKRADEAADETRIMRLRARSVDMQIADALLAAEQAVRYGILPDNAWDRSEFVRGWRMGLARVLGIYNTMQAASGAVEDPTHEES
jgi:hypothetical protein